MTFALPFFPCSLSCSTLFYCLFYILCFFVFCYCSILSSVALILSLLSFLTLFYYFFFYLLPPVVLHFDTNYKHRQFKRITFPYHFGMFYNIDELSLAPSCFSLPLHACPLVVGFGYLTQSPDKPQPQLLLTIFSTTKHQIHPNKLHAYYLHHTQ